MKEPRDHGGRLDAAIAEFGGAADDWLDLSTGINPTPYPVGTVSDGAWARLPDHGAFAQLEEAARWFWDVPEACSVLAAPGASALIARMPMLTDATQVSIAGPTYNEHAAAFEADGREVVAEGGAAQIVVQPNNPDGRLWDGGELMTGHRKLTVIDESFCDTCPENSLVRLADSPDVVVLKSFGKFWGLAGLRLGFAIGMPDKLAPLATSLGPWQVSGPALEIGARALNDAGWAIETREALALAANRLDRVVTKRGATLVGGTSLFRLYEFEDAEAAVKRFAENNILVRSFPYSKTWIRMGLPADETGWAQLERTLA